MATQPTQSVVSLPLAPSIRRALLCAGLSSMMDIRGLSEVDLMQGNTLVFCCHRTKAHVSIDRLCQHTLPWLKLQIATDCCTACCSGGTSPRVCIRGAAAGTGATTAGVEACW